MTCIQRELTMGTISTTKRHSIAIQPSAAGAAEGHPNNPTKEKGEKNVKTV